MANAQRSIKIIQLDSYTVTFQPDVDGAVQGQPLGANTGDLITWNNTTGRDLELQVLSIQPGPTPPPQIFQTIKLPPGASAPIFSVTQPSGTTITYCCKNPTKQQHSIVIGPVPRPKNGGPRPKNGGPRPKGGGPRPKGGGGGPRPKGGGGGPRPGGGGGPRPKGGGGGPRPK